jgi:alanine racemase
MQNMRATVAEIDLEAFRENLLKVRARTGDKKKILAVVKANAYGHGAFELSKKALESGADMLGVGIAEEGIELRERGILDAPVLVMGGVLEDQIESIVDHDLSLVLFSEDITRRLSETAVKKGKVVKIHVKVDTGMVRLGVPYKEAPGFFRSISGLKGIEIEGVLTHLACADNMKDEFTKVQISRFDRVLEELSSSGFRVPLIHAANSAAIINCPESYYTMVRPGIMLYGSTPDGRSNIGLKPVMTWKTRIINMLKIERGEGVSYGHTFHVGKKSLVGVLPVGYADGYSRLLSNKGKVIVHGKRVPVIGTVCMDMCLADVTDVPDVKVGDEVVLMGRQDKERVTAEEIAGLINTISYEIFCKVSARVPRVYL